MKQTDLVARLCERPGGYAWFLGAGASRAAGLPTAADIIWDIKRRHYAREENRPVARRDLQSSAVRERIQSFFDSHGLPALGAPDEYAAYFERVFGEDRERQRRYLRAILSEDHASLTVGNRVFGALIAAGFTRVAFTTNFDTVVETAVAEVGHQTLFPYHLEGARAANDALNNEEFPLYCKLHGDFRYDSLKNLPADLRTQNDDLSRCLVNAAGRFGFVVAGYSGRDDSVIRVFHDALDAPNPFPHGLYWTTMRDTDPPPTVLELIERASAQGVDAHVVETGTFDTLMLHLWRSIDDIPADLDARVRKSEPATVDIPLPPPGSAGPLLRIAALPILALPDRCHSLSFSAPKDWHHLREAMSAANGGLILHKAESVLAWGSRTTVRSAFGSDLKSIAEARLPTATDSRIRHLKGFLEHALAKSLAKGHPLLSRTRGYSANLIADRHADRAGLRPLADLVGSTAGTVPGVATSPTPEFPEPVPVRWAESLRVVVDDRNGRLWLLVHPDLWIWPPRARPDAQDFMERRRRDRLNRRYNELLDAWLEIVLGPDGPDVELSPFDHADPVENPRFLLGHRTAYARGRPQ